MEDGLILDEIDVPQVIAFGMQLLLLYVQYGSARFCTTYPLAKIQSHISSRKERLNQRLTAGENETPTNEAQGCKKTKVIEKRFLCMHV